MPGYDEYYVTPPAAATAGSPDGLGTVQAVSGIDNADFYQHDLFGTTTQRPEEASLGLGDNGFVAGKKVYQSIKGVGQTTLAPGAVAVIALAAITIRGFAGYFAGKAMAPNKASEKTYALWGVPTAIFFGAVGLGIQGAVSLSKK